MSSKQSLRDFIASVDYPLVHVNSVATPRGKSEAILSGDEQDWPACGDIWDLEGEVDADGFWEWDGEGDPHDGTTFSSVLLVQAYSDENEWNEQKEEYEAAFY